MDQASMESILQDLPLPAVRFYATIDSTNNEAWRWVGASAPRIALVVADEQTAGRGRLDRRWVTVAGSALAFSLVLVPPAITDATVSRLVGLAALSVCQSFQSTLHLQPQIKWPNDVLLYQRKVSGILVETRWEGAQLAAVVVGIGINIAPESLDPRLLPPAGLNFPATCVEAAVGHPVDRWRLLHTILERFLGQLPSIARPWLIDEWQSWLAFQGEWVTLSMEQPARDASGPGDILTGTLEGLSADGALKLLTASGELLTIPAGELQLRPARPPDDMKEDEHV